MIVFHRIFWKIVRPTFSSTKVWYILAIYLGSSIQNVSNLSRSFRPAMRDAYEIDRIVFFKMWPIYLSSLILSCSVMWYPCGSRQKAETDREISYNLLNFLDEAEGLNVVASSFDAKSRDLMIKGDDEFNFSFIASQPRITGRIS